MLCMFAQTMNRLNLRVYGRSVPPKQSPDYCAHTWKLLLGGHINPIFGRAFPEKCLAIPCLPNLPQPSFPLVCAQIPSPLNWFTQANETDVTTDISERFSLWKEWEKCESVQHWKWPLVLEKTQNYSAEYGISTEDADAAQDEAFFKANIWRT